MYSVRQKNQERHGSCSSHYIIEVAGGLTYTFTPVHFTAHRGKTLPSPVWAVTLTALGPSLIKIYFYCGFSADTRRGARSAPHFPSWLPRRQPSPPTHPPTPSPALIYASAQRAKPNVPLHWQQGCACRTCGLTLSRSRTRTTGSSTACFSCGGSGRRGGAKAD